MLRMTGVFASVVAAAASAFLMLVPFFVNVPVGLGSFVAPAASAAIFVAAFTTLRSTTITSRKWGLFAAVCLIGLIWLGGVVVAVSRGGRNTATLFLLFLVLPAVLVAIGLAQRPVRNPQP
jgi:hypothetical protein